MCKMRSKIAVFRTALYLKTARRFYRYPADIYSHIELDLSLNAVGINYILVSKYMFELFSKFACEHAQLTFRNHCALVSP